MTPEQRDELLRIWAIHENAIGIELLRENDPGTLKKISDPIALSPEVRTAGKPGPTKVQQITKAVGDYLSDVFEGATEPFAKEIRKLVCVELKYCERRLKGHTEAEGLNLAMTIIDGFMMLKLAMPFPPTWTATYLLKKGFFDNLCGCDLSKK